MKKNLGARREFLQTGVTATGAVVAAPSIFLRPEAIPPAWTSVAASDQVRFGIIGIGMQGSGLLATAVQLPGVKCVAACDLYDGRHTLAKEIAGANVRPTRRYQGLLSGKEN